MANHVSWSEISAVTETMDSGDGEIGIQIHPVTFVVSRVETIEPQSQNNPDSVAKPESQDKEDPTSCSVQPQTNPSADAFLTASYSDLQKLSDEQMEIYFLKKTVWGTNHRLFNAPVQEYAKMKKFEVGFKGNCSTSKTAYCRFPNCTWMIHWTISKKLDPPSWSVKRHNENHSEACLGKSSDVFSKDSKSQTLSAKDIARLILPDVRELGEPTALNPKDIHDLIMPFVPASKHTNKEFIRALRKRVMDVLKGPFAKKSPTETDGFRPSSSSSECPEQTTPRSVRRTDPLAGLTAFKAVYEEKHPRNQLVIHTTPSPTGGERYLCST